MNKDGFKTLLPSLSSAGEAERIVHDTENLHASLSQLSSERTPQFVVAQYSRAEQTAHCVRTDEELEGKPGTKWYSDIPFESIVRWTKPENMLHV
jgi:hypothetical protein